MASGTKPPGIKQIHDLGPDTKMADRFTVVLADTRFGRVGGKTVLLYDALSLGETPDSPNGFSQATEVVLGKHLGKRITWQQLPLNVRKHVNRRFADAGMPTSRAPRRRNSMGKR